MECDKRGKSKLYINASSTNPIDHLKESHGITESGDSTPETPVSESSDTSTIPGLFNRSQKRARNELYSKALIDQFKEKLIKWIVNYQIALIAVENESFKNLLYLCNPGMASFLPESGDIIRTWIMETFMITKELLKREIHSESISMFHVSFDL
jgi:hypothetical protein